MTSVGNFVKRMVLIAAASTTLAMGQVTLNLGSDGSYGAINIAPSTTTTLAMPSNGFFHCTTITIGKNAVLKFTRNPLNTPVYLLASGDILIEGEIDVDGSNGTGTLAGQGGPGGFDGGAPGMTGVPNGDGHGPGGGVDTTADPLDRNANSDYLTPLLIPIVGGSGGSGQDNRAPTPSAFVGGGGGGGAIVVASNTKIQLACFGSISAQRGLLSGSHGAIRLVSPIIEEIACSDATTTDVRLYASRIRMDAITKSGIPDIGITVGTLSVGTAMFVLPANLPSLQVTSVAGNAVPPGGPAVFVLPTGSPTSQNVVVEAEDFTGTSLNIDIQIIPENGGSTIYPATIDLTAGNPATITVPVTFPVNMGTRVCVWTRP